MTTPLVAYRFPAREGSTLFDVPEGQRNLGIGAPDHGLLRNAQDAYTAAVTKTMTRPQSHQLFQYGPVQGDGGFLTALASFLTQMYADVPAAPQQLVVTSGASFGLALLCQLFCRPGQIVFMEDPCYFIARDIFRDAQLRIVPVPSDSNGLDTDALEAALSQHAPVPTDSSRQAAPAAFQCMIYLVPTFGNPTGRTLTLERRRRLIELAYRHSALVVCDDVYNGLKFESAHQPPTRVVALDTGPGCVVSNGSFSKLFGPGVRLGLFEAQPGLVAKILSRYEANASTPKSLVLLMARSSRVAGTGFRLIVEFRNET